MTLHSAFISYRQPTDLSSSDVLLHLMKFMTFRKQGQVSSDSKGWLQYVCFCQLCAGYT